MVRQKKTQVRGRFLNFSPPNREIQVSKSSNRVRIDSCGCYGVARDSHSEHSGIGPWPSPPGEKRLRGRLPHGLQMWAYCRGLPGDGADSPFCRRGAIMENDDIARVRVMERTNEDVEFRIGSQDLKSFATPGPPKRVAGERSASSTDARPSSLS